ncbi:hypothetical protein PCL_06802 [Purpureocillium lilacinum]|uniref:Uncharacterized protein n=1 Tax=Purpureocillium lilacinum TaxID=33203 RepID=A0A2U3DTL9_PURLI|nr:hypothetical protein Purlil1_9579 [Purpureocillium lilacinum]PWI65597.1 hypothetical protein PCL_06802 [Purpureocillium lilacinum]
MIPLPSISGTGRWHPDTAIGSRAHASPICPSPVCLNAPEAPLILARPTGDQQEAKTRATCPRRRKRGPDPDHTAPSPGGSDNVDAPCRHVGAVR